MGVPVFEGLEKLWVSQFSRPSFRAPVFPLGVPVFHNSAVEWIERSRRRQCMVIEGLEKLWVSQFSSSHPSLRVSHAQLHHASLNGDVRSHEVDKPCRGQRIQQTSKTHCLARDTASERTRLVEQHCGARIHFACSADRRQ